MQRSCIVFAVDPRVMVAAARERRRQQVMPKAVAVYPALLGECYWCTEDSVSLPPGPCQVGVARWPVTLACGD